MPQEEDSFQGDVVCSYNTTVETFVPKQRASKLMRWHGEDRKKDRKLRVPADGSQWRKIKRKYWEDFAGDARNVWFGLSADGINPFGEQKQQP